MKAIAATLGLTIDPSDGGAHIDAPTRMILNNCCKITEDFRGYWHLYRLRHHEAIMHTITTNPNAHNDKYTRDIINSHSRQFSSGEWAGLGALMESTTQYLTRRQRAYLRVHYYDTTATLRDYMELGITLLPPKLPSGLRAPMESAIDSIPDVWVPEKGLSMYSRGETGTGSIIQLTLTSVSKVLRRNLTTWEKELCAANLGGAEWSVAAMLLGLNCLQPSVRAFIVDSKMHYLPLPEWPKTYATWMNALKRCPILPHPYRAMPQEIMMLRKIFSCCIRTHAEADWEAEWDRRAQNIPAHYALTPQGKLSRQLWVSDVMVTTDRLAAEVIGETLDATHPKDLLDWWADRAAWAPSGSSSNRAGVMQVLKNCSPDDYSAMARPSKKELVEQLPNDWPERILKSEPMRIARGSTKPEPGGKQRAVLAVADDHFFVAAFASLHVEKHMNVWGMKAKQTPADVCEWIMQDLYAPAGAMWNSLDYSDYNSEHECWQLAYMSLALAKQWDRQYTLTGQQYCKSRARCSEWVATAQCNSWIQVPYGKINPDASLEHRSPLPENVRVYAGLYSGDRDTARDNTLLHGVYSAVAMTAVKRAGVSGTLLSNNMTGDDEDALFSDWIISNLYLEVHRQEGFVLKNAKQQCGEMHEFLQRQAGGGSLPTRPLFALLAQLASGNWYHDVHIWYDSSIQAVSDNLWEAHTRGMPILYARELAKIILDATMRVPMSYEADRVSEWKYLEWWTYRHGSSLHPLWANTNGPTAPPLVVDAKPLAPRSYPRAATDAYIAARRNQLPLSADKWERYAVQRLRESYATWFMKQRADAHSHFAKNVWPTRTHTPSEDDLNARTLSMLSREEVLNMLAAIQLDRRPTTTAEVLARMDLDEQLLSLVGGWANLRALLPMELLSRYEHPATPRMVRPEWWHLDPALRSALAHSHAAPEHPGIGATDPTLTMRAVNASISSRNAALASTSEVITLICAPNGGGKTTFANTHPQYADLDELVVAIGIYDAYRRFSKHKQRLLPPVDARDAIWTVLRNRQYVGLLAQYTPTELIPPPSERSWRVKIIVVDPPEELILARLRARQWSEERIHKKYSRWREAINKLHTAISLTDEERASIKHTNSWDL